MSVGMASFGMRGEELDVVAVARRAGEMIWDRKAQIWPYLLALAAVETVARWVAWQYALPTDGVWNSHGGDLSLAEFARRGAWSCGRALVGGVAMAMLLRALLAYPHAPWRPDRGLFVASAIFLAAAAVPVALFAPTALAWQGGGFSAVSLTAATALGGVIGLVALAYFCLRLVIWPIGAAVEDPQMTAGHAWNAMPGARMAWLFAGVLLSLPLLFGAAFAQAFVYGFSGRHVIGEGPWSGPLHALIVLLWLAAGAAVYQMRSERASTP